MRSPRSAGHAHAETLRWKLNPGEVLHYTMESKEVVERQCPGRGQEIDQDETTNLSWTVNSVSANGDAEITLPIRPRSNASREPPFVPLEFDSSPNNKQIPDEFEAARSPDQGHGGRGVYIQAPAQRRGR